MTTTTHERFTVTFEAKPDPHGLDAARRLARVLKFAWRSCGLRCVRAIEAHPDAPQISGDASAGTRCGAGQNTPAASLTTQKRN